MMKMLNMKMKKRKGFTLIELVVVIAILGILVAIAVPKLSESRKNAAVSAHNANVRTLESAASMFIAAEGVKEAEWKGSDATTEGWDKYLQAWPKKPNGTAEKDINGEDVDGVGYEVKIDAEGNITVKPATISTED